MLSLTSGFILQKFGQKKCLNYSLLAQAISAVAILVIGIMNSHSPLVITGVILLYTVSLSFPCSILYPLSIELIPGCSGKISAVINAVRLIMTAISLEFVGYIYSGGVLPISGVMSGMIVLFLALVVVLRRKGWLVLVS